ncbi:MAG: hypothetical protein Satyrvirus12_13 [Satyrvirus sp.]|uniref:Uncharacterized protein n=1 Tax=Satyrvirus sp. TaxID=2487771 RepID=A0A3G5AIW0_9VIRU|nr:MAG: hypothetical protein Satyrvirus12_13 [Satyrvirus sp.]
MIFTYEFKLNCFHKNNIIIKKICLQRSNIDKDYSYKEIYFPEEVIKKLAQMCFVVALSGEVHHCQMEDM